jgi:hypothetical protein
MPAMNTGIVDARLPAPGGQVPSTPVDPGDGTDLPATTAVHTQASTASEGGKTIRF